MELENVIEKLSIDASQCVIVCTPTTTSNNERTYINGVILDEPNNAYMTHFIRTKYKRLPTAVLYCDADGEDFFHTLTVVHKVLKYPIKDIHVIFDKSLPEDCNMNPDVLKNQCDILERRVADFVSMDENERRNRYFVGELIVLG